MPGYISLHRDIRNNWLYEEDRVFSRYEAWLDILMRVNHTEGKTTHNGTLETISRGSTIWSMGDMEKHWKWSNSKVRAFLKRLKNDEMLVVKSTTKKTYLTVVNYDFYQDYKKEETPPKHHQSTTETPAKHTNNNVNNSKKVNKVKEEVIKILYGDHVLLTDDQYRKLLADLTEPCVTKLIEDINYWFAQKPLRIKDYKDHNLMIRKWHKNNLDKKLTVVQGGGNGEKFEGRTQGIRYGSVQGKSREPSFPDSELDEMYRASESRLLNM